MKNKLITKKKYSCGNPASGFSAHDYSYYRNIDNKKEILGICKKCGCWAKCEFMNELEECFKEELKNEK